MGSPQSNPSGSYDLGQRKLVTRDVKEIRNPGVGKEPGAGVSTLAVPWTWCDTASLQTSISHLKMTRATLSFSIKNAKGSKCIHSLWGCAAQQGALSACLGVVVAPTSCQLWDLEEVIHCFC